MLISLGPDIRTFTDSLGNYSFNVTPDIYNVELLPNNPIYGLLCAGPINVDASGINDNISDVDFFVEFPPKKDLKIYVVKGFARPGFDQELRIYVKNYGDEPASGNVIFQHDSLQQFESGIPQDYSYDQSINTVSWSFDSIPPGDQKVFSVTMKIASTIPIGTLLSMYFEANPIIDDLTPENNIKNCTVEVRGSYDPNDKQVDPIGDGPSGEVYNLDQMLSYLIRFQNTGTDTAFTVVLRDTLNSNLDFETVVPGASSHNYEATFESEGVLAFTFPNINLPDSTTNEPESHGWVF